MNAIWINIIRKKGTRMTATKTIKGLSLLSVCVFCLHFSYMMFFHHRHSLSPWLLNAVGWIRNANLISSLIIITQVVFLISLLFFKKICFILCHKFLDIWCFMFLSNNINTLFLIRRSVVRISQPTNKNLFYI